MLILVNQYITFLFYIWSQLIVAANYVVDKQFMEKQCYGSNKYNGVNREPIRC